jgi:hypothetical protein
MTMASKHYDRRAHRLYSRAILAAVVTVVALAWSVSATFGAGTLAGYPSVCFAVAGSFAVITAWCLWRGRRLDVAAYWQLAAAATPEPTSATARDATPPTRTVPPAPPVPPAAPALVPRPLPGPQPTPAAPGRVAPAWQPTWTPQPAPALPVAPAPAVSPPVVPAGAPH